MGVRAVFRYLIRELYAIPRTLTLIDLSVVVSAVKRAALVWHGAVLRREASVTDSTTNECSTAGVRRQSAGPGVEPGMRQA